MPWGAIIGAAGSVIGGALNNRKQTVQTSSAPTYTADQTAMQGAIAQALQARMKTPASFEPMKSAAIDSVNKTYSGIGKRMESTLASRGFGGSGKVVSGQRQIELARAGELGGLESKFAGLQLDQENRVIDEAMRFGFATPSTQSTQTIPGNMLGGGIGAGLETITSLFALDRLLKGGKPKPMSENPNDSYDAYEDESPDE